MIGVYKMEARLSLIGKNIGTSARFYVFTRRLITEKSNTKKLCIFLTGGAYALTPLVWLHHCYADVRNETLKRS